MANIAPVNAPATDGAAGWRDAQIALTSFMRDHPRQWWAIDRLAGSVGLPQGYVTMLLVELWIDGRVAREWAGDQPIFQLQKPS